ncbi:MAG: GNAT family N-acetyltransferase [Fidelibacterota bacterium]
MRAWQDKPEVGLTPVDESDLIFWHELTSQPEAREHQPLPQRSSDELREELQRYSQSDLLHPTHRRYKWVVRDLSSGKRVGVISFDKLDPDHGIGRIGYTISRDFWGQGYGTAAVGAVVEKIFRESDTERIEAECSIHNPASVRVLEKNGFGLEGIKRGYLDIGGKRVDHFSFGLLRSDWEASWQ